MRVKITLACSECKQRNYDTTKNKPKLTERIARFFREYRSELKKVVWSTPQQTLNNTILVAVSVVVTSVCIGILDFAFSTGLTALGRLI